MEEQDIANKTFEVDGDGLLSTTISTIKSTDNDISKSSLDDDMMVPSQESSNGGKHPDDEIAIKANGDGSDSGVEIGAPSSLNNILQRALSSNSGGYTSSCGGNEDNVGPVSCNSSMISYCSDTCDKTNSTIVLQNDCYASEGGSESSSITGDPTIRKLNATAKKKVAMKDGINNKSPRRSNESTSSTRSRPSVNRSVSLSIKASAPQLATRERARSRDKTKAPEVIPQKTSLMTSSLTRSMSLKRPPKPDSFPTSIKDASLTFSSPRVNLSRTPSLTRGKTPLATPVNDDGRWPSIGNRTPRVIRNPQVSTPEGLVIRTRIGNIQLDNKATFDKYATLPRRRKEKSTEDLKNSANDSRSSSQTRNGDGILPNRMTSSLMAVTKKKESPQLQVQQKTLPGKFLTLTFFKNSKSNL